MKQSYEFEYLNENEFHEKEYSYNWQTYKKLILEYYPEIQKGNFLGKLVSESKKDKTKSYELVLPTDKLFATRFRGEITLHYTVYEDKKIIMLTNITPDVSTKDMFKFNLLNMLQK